MMSVLSQCSYYTSSSGKGKKSEGLSVESDESAVPDSTTAGTEREMSDFCIGQDVLLKQKDGRYYLGTIIEVDTIRDQCLVKFGDNTESWSGYKDLTKLSTPEQEDLLCVICKKSAPKNKQEITVCDKCGRGYHQRCHQPEIPVSCQKEGATWMCKRCLDSEPHRLRRNDLKHFRRESLRSTTSSGSESQIATSTCNKVFTYELESLSWDTYHRVNAEQIYCYCGSTGEWYRQMLQCSRCRQWFHEKCLDCCQYPLYCGDRFYVFVCAVCNHGNEFLRRLEMKWVDLVHLMLFNLTVYHGKKYYDLDSVIIPYINDNWHALQLSPKISSVSKSERRENILSVLTNNRNRFKCGREIKKRTTIWGLRIRLPPPEPNISLPTIGFINEEQLRTSWQGNKRLQFLPAEGNVHTKIVPMDNHMTNIMMGTTYQQNSTPSETDSPCPSPEIIQERNRSETPKPVFKPEYIGAGCVKKSVPFPKMSLQRRKRLLSLNQERRRILRKTKRRSLIENNSSKSDKSRGYVTRLSLDSKTTNNNNDTLPLTPPTSVSAPPTPPASGSTVLSDLSNDFSEHSANTFNNVKSTSLKKSSSCAVETNSVELNTPCDTSGDETSSKSTLDLIIPPPKDFEGKNNPFLTLLSRGNVEDKSKQRRSKDSITLPLPLTAVIPGKPVMRPTKRQLSEKDIIVGPNGEVKRRRFRRNRLSFSGGQAASKTAAVVPARADPTKDWGTRPNQAGAGVPNCALVDYTFTTSRRLRQRPDKNAEKEKTSNPPTPKASPVKQEPDISMDDLKSSVNIYFGAANRIAAGERFGVKAKRMGPSGKTEYLIEWEGPSNGMT